MLDGKIMKQETKSIWEGGKSKKLDYSVTLTQGMHVIELYGAEKCCDGTTKWSFSVEVFDDNKNSDKCLSSQKGWEAAKYKKNACAQGKQWCKDKKWGKDVKKCCPCACDPKNCTFSTGWMDWTVANFDKKYSLEKTTTNKTTTTYVYKKPMNAIISVKTVKFNKNAIKYLGDLKEAIEKKPTKGYCEKIVPSMAQVSNQKLCGGVNRNVGYYYKVSFPVGENGTQYNFRMPTDFGLGGVSILDGKIMKQESKDIWQSGRATQLNFAVNLTAGQHVLEVYGAEGCCDGTTKW